MNISEMDSFVNLVDELYAERKIKAELLEALRRCVGSLRTVSPGGDGDHDVEFATAAIAKATGETK